MSPDRTDVLVVGAGLAGLSCAVFLAWHGVRCTVVERHSGLLRHPRQRSLAPRTLELYRQVGLAERLRAAAADFVGPADYVAVRAETLASDTYRPVANHVDPRSAAAASPCTGLTIDQDRVEEVLQDRAIELGARIHFGTTLYGRVEGGDGVSALLRDTGGAERRLRAAYLVAADGADSPIRHRLGVPLIGPGTLFSLLTLVIEADLRPALRGRTVHMAYLERPRPRTFLMARDTSGLRWVFGTSEAAAGDPVELVRAAAGLPTAAVRLLPQVPGTATTALRFVVGAGVATTYRIGRVFLIGDAAHLMPPTGGFGAATGVADAHNLAWKLAAVLRGRAGARLLDTYDRERRPVGEFTVRQALARSQDRFRTAFGTDEPIERNTVMFGYRYGDGDHPSEPVAAHELCGRPGTRAPHVPLTDDPTGPSTLDHYGSGFVLLTGPDGGEWAAAVGELPVPVEVHRLDGAHLSRHGIGARGALLVRPDGFVAWRSPEAPSDPGAELRAALDAALCRGSTP